MTRKHYNDGFEGHPLEAGITWWPGEGQSIEAGTGETEGLDAERESGGALQAQAPNPPVTLPIHGEMREALTKALTFACMTLAFIGRDRGTDRIDQTLDGLCAEAVEVEKVARNALQGDGL